VLCGSNNNNQLKQKNQWNTSSALSSPAVQYMWATHMDRRPLME
jgi:hypothetical protein